MNGRLYALLPVYVRQRDLETPGQPLCALLRVVEEQVDAVEADIAQLYENWFIETCSEWVVPYIGDLIGYRAPRDAAAARIVPRSDVADTIRMRRRKGTLAVLETLARDVAGWPAAAVEYERLIAVTQAVNDVQAARGRTADLRDARALRAIGGADDVTAHTVEVRRPGSRRAPGRYGIGSVGLLVSRLRSYSVSRSDAYCCGDEGDHCFTFDAFGADVALMPADDPLPVPLTRARLAAGLARYYGPQRSLAIWTRPRGKRTALEPVARERVVVADLSAWRLRVAPGDVAVDPERGRLAFAPGHAPHAVVVRYHYGAAADRGAGEYARALAPVEPVFRVAHGGREERDHLRAAVRAWEAAEPPRAAIEFGDSHVYDERDLTIELAADQYLELRAADGTRPVVRFPDENVGQLDMLRVGGGPRSTLVIDGLLIAGRGIEIAGDVGHVIVRRSTLMPRGTIVLVSPTARLSVEHSIVGPIRAIADETQREPNPVSIADSVVDAFDHRGEAIGAPEAGPAFVDARFARATIFGHVKLHGLELAEHTIFAQPLTVLRRQRGCLRFCSLAPHSRTPPRYACEFDGPPRFASVRYGTPGYARLARDCPVSILTGAEDEAELGVFHDAFESLREANLRQRLAEFVPVDADVGIRYVGET